MPTTEAVRSTVYLESDLHQALRLKAAHSQRSMSSQWHGHDQALC